MKLSIKELQDLLIESVEVDVKIINSGTLLATATVKLADVLVLKDFTIKESKFPHKVFEDNIWIDVPVQKLSLGKYKKLIFFENKEFWRALEEKVYRSYKEEEQDE